MVWAAVSEIEDPRVSNIRSGDLQKLFCAFPDGRPGFGLLLLRAFVSVTLIAQTIIYMTATDSNALNVSVASVALVSAGCLLVGFLTPSVAIVIGLGAIGWTFLRVPLPLQYVFAPMDTVVDVVVLSAAILLLGPGAFSVDARMFGRREIRIPVVSNALPK